MFQATIYWFFFCFFFCLFFFFHLCCVFSDRMLILGWEWCSIVWRQGAFKNLPNFVLLSHQRNIVHHNRFMDNWIFTISANMSCLLSSMLLISQKVYSHHEKLSHFYVFFKKQKTKNFLFQQRNSEMADFLFQSRFLREMKTARKA